MKITLLSIAIAAAALSSGGLVLASSISPGQCDYNSDGQYIDPDTGQVSAWGTMDSAAKCAATGDLPEAVINRLGKFGHLDRADAIIAIDAEAKRDRQERNEEQ